MHDGPTMQKNIAAAPSLVALLEAGVHFGHDRSKQNPKMKPYIFTQRNRVAILDLEKTVIGLEAAVTFLKQIAAQQNKEILFVGTKRQAREVVERHARRAGQPFVVKRWLGGTLTNFATILKSIEKLEELKSLESSGDAEKLTKKELAVRRKEISRLENVLEGIKSLRSLPAAVVVVGSHDEKLAVAEAHRVKLPVVGLVDSNADPDQVDYPIPANDDAVRSLDMLVATLADAIIEARPPTGPAAPTAQLVAPTPHA